MSVSDDDAASTKCLDVASFIWKIGWGRCDKNNDVRDGELSSSFFQFRFYAVALFNGGVYRTFAIPSNSCQHIKIVSQKQQIQTLLFNDCTLSIIPLQSAQWSNVSLIRLLASISFIDCQTWSFGCIRVNKACCIVKPYWFICPLSDRCGFNAIESWEQKCCPETFSVGSTLEYPEYVTSAVDLEMIMSRKVGITDGYSSLERQEIKHGLGNFTRYYLQQA